MADFGMGALKSRSTNLNRPPPKPPHRLIRSETIKSPFRPPDVEPNEVHIYVDTQGVQHLFRPGQRVGWFQQKAFRVFHRVEILKHDCNISLEVTCSDSVNAFIVNLSVGYRVIDAAKYLSYGEDDPEQLATKAVLSRVRPLNHRFSFENLPVFQSQLEAALGEEETGTGLKLSFGDPHVSLTEGAARVLSDKVDISTQAYLNTAKVLAETKVNTTRLGSAIQGHEGSEREQLMQLYIAEGKSPSEAYLLATKELLEISATRINLQSQADQSNVDFDMSQVLGTSNHGPSLQEDGSQKALIQTTAEEDPPLESYENFLDSSPPS